jgi:ribosome silencing factor RsfS/YbeB/iojap/nicotinate (nicotinamide) nucleotide adenylyltransferase
MKRVGLLGGTFNPPHGGHMKLAELAQGSLGLDELRLVPTALPPHKPMPELDGPARLALLRTLPYPVETLEIDRGGASYTVDTLEALAAREPGTAWILVMGSDQIAGFGAWKRPERILELASLAVSPRPGFEEPALPALLQGRARSAWSGAPGEVVPLPGTALDLASTALREDLALGRDPSGIPSQVLAVICRENQYRNVCLGERMTLEPRLASVVEAARSKKAFRIRLFDVSGIASFTDTFAFMSGSSDRQNRAIADAVEEHLKVLGTRPLCREGEQNGNWILLDFGDIIVHVMDEETRAFYNLEGLWKEGRELELPPEEAPSASKTEHREG